jgi:ribosomal protein S18 acetylase RimI-like enzyme
MTHDEIRIIAEIVGEDKQYKHFVNRINKEFEASDEERNSKVYVRFIERDGKKVGFSVIGYSPAKMAVWKKTFQEEGWVGSDFEMEDDPFELMYMYVKPNYRNKGIAEKLFSDVVGFTKNKKVNEIYAYVSDRTPQALNFYKKMQAEILQDFSDEGIASAFLRWRL